MVCAKGDQSLVGDLHAVLDSYLNLFSAFSQQYKKSNRGHDIFLYTFSFILAKTQISIWNNFDDIFIQISGKYKKYVTQRYAIACSKKIHTIIWFWI